MCVSMSVCEDQRLISVVFYILTNFLRKGLLRNLELTVSTRLSDQRASESLLSPSPISGVTDAHTTTSNIFMVARDQIWVPYACVGRTSEPVPSPQHFELWIHRSVEINYTSPH